MPQSPLSDSLSSRAIDLARGLLLMSVILIHCSPLSLMSAGDVDYGSVHELTWGLWLAVQVFFAISGYLFYMGMDRFDAGVFGAKMLRRVRTLLVPYLLWCTIYGIVRIIKAKYLGYPGEGLVVDGNISVIGFLKGYWISQGTYPMAFCLWFVRNLIVFVALSIPAYFIARNVFLTVAAIAASTCLVPMYGMEYFIFGGFIALADKDCTRLVPLRGALMMFVGVPAVLFALRHTGYYREWMYAPAACMFFLAVMPVARCLAGCAFWQRFNDYFSNSYFFVYAVHGLYSSLIAAVVAGLSGLISPLRIALCWLMSFVVITALSWTIYRLAKVLWPAAVRVLCGGRS